MEKISVNVVATGSSNDHSTRLYNKGNGFRDVTGKVTCGIADCLYLGFTAERKYVVKVEGALVLSTETSDASKTQTDGVYGFDIDWSQTAKAYGTGEGKIIITNPDAPSEVSTFEVVIGDRPTVRVVFPFGAGNYARVNVRDADISVVDKAVQTLLSANDDDNAYSIGLAFYQAIMPALGDNAFRVLTDIDYVFGDRRFPSWGNGPIEEENPVKHTKLFRIDEQPGFADPSDLLVGRPNYSSRADYTNEEHRVPVFGDYNHENVGAEHEIMGDVMGPLLGEYLRLVGVLGHEVPHEGGEVARHEVLHPGILVGSRNFNALSDLDMVLIIPTGEPKPNRLDLATRQEMVQRALDGVPFFGPADHPSFAKLSIPAFTVVDASAFGDQDLSGLMGKQDGYKDTMPLAVALCDDAWPNTHYRYHSPEDVIAHDGDFAVMRAGIEELLGHDRFREEVKEPEMRDFSQLACTRDHDLERIETAVAAANALGIDTSHVAPARDAAREKLVVFSDRFETGGMQAVTEAETAVIVEVLTELYSIGSDLETCVSNWHHYKQHEATHDRWEARLADRKRYFQPAVGEEGNVVAKNLITHAANPEEILASSKAAFVELFQAIQRRNFWAAHQADSKARQFSTREHMLDLLITRGKVVAVENPSTTA